MAKGAPTLRFLFIGEVPDTFQRQLLALAHGRRMQPKEMPNTPVESLVQLDTLILGDRIDESVLEGWLPSLRIANPTMEVVGVSDTSKSFSSGLGNWVDRVLESESSRKAFVDRLQNRLRGGGFREHATKAIKRVWTIFVPFAAIFSVWWAIVALFEPRPFLLPGPEAVLGAFFAQSDRFVLHALTTAKEAILGFFLGNSLGILLAILLYRFVRMRVLTLPVLISFQAIPIVAFAPLLNVWLGTGLESKVAMASIICFFPMVINSLQAFSSVQTEYLELFRLYKASYRITLKRLLLPASAPAIIAALKISAGLSVVGAIVAEMIGANMGLGYLILTASYRLETDIMFVGMLLSGVVGVLFFHMPELFRAFLPLSWQRGLN